VEVEVAAASASDRNVVGTRTGGAGGPSRFASDRKRCLCPDGYLHSDITPDQGLCNHGIGAPRSIAWDR
jgi:hypothetical protein